MFADLAQQFQSTIAQAEAQPPSTSAWTLRYNFDALIDLSKTTVLSQAADNSSTTATQGTFRAGGNLPGYQYEVATSTLQLARSAAQ